MEYIKMPKLGLTMVDARIGRCMVQDGAYVEKGALLYEIETDKVTSHIEAPWSGFFRALCTEGDVIEVGMQFAVIYQEGEDWGAPKKTEDSPVRITPAARKAAKEHGIELSLVQPDTTGKITEKEVLSSLQSNKIRLTPVAKKVLAAGSVSPESLQLAPNTRVTKRMAEALTAGKDSALEKSVDLPLSVIQRRTAEKMAESKRDIPHFYLSVDVDMGELIELKAEVDRKNTANGHLKTSINDYLIRFCALGIQKHPILNTRYKHDKLIANLAVNIGLAVAVENGLLVPVIHRADTLTIREISKERSRLVNMAKSGGLTLEDMSEGSFTISNLGGFGIDSFLAIINPPEAAILTVGRMTDKPCVREGKICIRPFISLGLSGDHRILDGAQGAGFLQTLVSWIEKPWDWLLENF